MERHYTMVMPEVTAEVCLQVWEYRYPEGPEFLKCINKKSYEIQSF